MEKKTENMDLYNYMRVTWSFNDSFFEYNFDFRFIAVIDILYVVVTKVKHT